MNNNNNKNNKNNDDNNNDDDDDNNNNDNNNNVIYFDYFGVEHIPKEIKTFINNKNIKTNIFRIQAYDSIMCGYFCIGFIDFMLTEKNSTEYTHFFSPNNFKKNDNINPRVSKTRNNRTMVLSKCATCGSKKSRFIKNQEAKALLSNLGIKTPLSKVGILGDIFF